ncbi:hypothetical protein [Pantoea anthophila]|uniref:hypothetical protein n=1 Tax=Pantoea anthophila TaxID=470931 RepID=UPI00278908D5|nr:hypothetical protein [Pantoea anthophila]MDQ1210966.1 glutathione S-transferase [Pantoea anthophila]
MNIYDWQDGPYPARVRIALAEKGLLSQVEFIPVNLWKEEHIKADFFSHQLLRHTSGVRTE